MSRRITLAKALVGSAVKSSERGVQRAAEREEIAKAKVERERDLAKQRIADAQDQHLETHDAVDTAQGELETLQAAHAVLRS